MQIKTVSDSKNDVQSTNKKLSMEGDKKMTAEVNGNQALRDEYQDYLTIIEEKLSIPDEFDLKSVTNDLEQNGKGILLVRYVPEKINNDLFGEHFSVTIEKETKLILGFTHMDQKYTLSDDQKLLSKEETKRIAKQFFDQFDPGYFETLENLWIDQHDETIILEGHEVTVSGMKYKCYRPSTSDYSWLIVGSNGEVITFERGIVWEAGRVTEKWLHDSYIKEKL
ncbi:hypothetical protein RV18_GL000124 [Enterococcus termitis]|nr:hypothetical protein RV18_GL000124 [Enterococcus termitis]